MSIELGFNQNLRNHVSATSYARRTDIVIARGSLDFLFDQRNSGMGMTNGLATIGSFLSGYIIWLVSMIKIPFFYVALGPWFKF